jgi:hypothetical protein
MKILLAGGIIDFYVNKEVYKKYKTKRARFNYVYKVLAEFLNSIKGKVINGIEIREATITSNNFWGIDDFCIINDLGYSGSNETPLNKEKITLRIFQIDFVGVIVEEKSLYDCFLTIKDENFLIVFANAKIV